MANHTFPAHLLFQDLTLEPEDRSCPQCGRWMWVCDHRHHRFYTLNGPVHLVAKLAHCPDRTCASRPRTFAPVAELALAPPRWVIGWDVLAWLGHRRFAQDWRVAQLRAELRERYDIRLSDDAIASYLAHYQRIVAARHQDAERLAAVYRDVPDVVLSIDGLQPEKGHETLYVVRELNARRVWFAEPLLSSAASEIERVLQTAATWATRLGKPVRGWISDKQDAFLTGIAKVFPGVPHQFCTNHFVREAAKAMLEADSQAKVQMRRKVRGLRAIERAILTTPTESAPVQSPTDASAVAVVSTPVVSTPVVSTPVVSTPVVSTPVVSTPVVSAPVVSVPLPPAARVVLDYCAMTRGILNNDQGSPIAPPGVRMADALGDVRASLDRVLATSKGGSATPT